MRAAAAVVLVVALAGATPARAQPAPHWYRVDSPTDARLERIEFASPTAGWAVGSEAAVLRYDGSGWRVVPGPRKRSSFHALAVVGEDEFWAAGGGNRLFHYRQGTWQRIFLGDDVIITAVDFSSPDNGYAVGLFGFVYRWDGQDWHRVRAPMFSNDLESSFRSVAALAPDDVWISGNRMLLHYDGESWQRKEPEILGGARFGNLWSYEGTVILAGDPTLIWRDGAWQRFAGATGRVVRQGRFMWALATATDEVERDAAVTQLLRRDLQSGAEELVTVASGLGAITDLAVAGGTAWAVGPKGAIFCTHEERLPSFQNGTYEAGLGVLAKGRAVLRADIDGDRMPDLLVLNQDSKPRFLRAFEPGAFRERSLDADYLRGARVDRRALLVDLDGDGAPDYISRRSGGSGAPGLRVLRNLDRGRFVEVDDSGFGPLAESDPGEEGSVEVGDLDGDGDLDVYAVRYADAVNSRPLPNLAWINDGVGKLSPLALSVRDGGDSWTWGRTALLTDLTGDGLLDIFTCNLWGDGNHLFVQGPPGEYSDHTQQAGVLGGYAITLDAVSGDFDNDGDLDLFVHRNCATGNPSRLYRNDGGGRLRDVTSDAGLSSCGQAVHYHVGTVDAGDLDNDGDVDLVAAMAAPFDRYIEGAEVRTRIYLNDGAGRFTDVSVMTGVGGEAHSFLLEDLDEDGDLDLYLVKDGEPNELFVNANSERNWLRVSLEAAPPNRSAIGAQVRVLEPDGSPVGFRETSWRHPVAHFGLGARDEVDVVVRFPSGVTVTERGVRAGSKLTVREQSGARLFLARVRFFFRNRLAWADTRAEAWKLGAALVLLLLTLVVARSLRARRIVPRWYFSAAATVLYAVTAFACMRTAPVSTAAQVLPLASLGGLCLVALFFDRQYTRKAEARFIGPYEIIEVIGQGGMGTVYRARETTIRGRRVVALKVLRPELMEDRQSQKRFAREAELAARVDHPGVVHVFGSGECRVLDGRVKRRTIYIVMEHVDGRSLRDMTKEDGPLRVRRAVEIARDAADALHAAHMAGVLHRDVKSDNILVAADGSVKLTDFGIAGATQVTTLTTVGSIMGTLLYMSPEQARGEELDIRCDIYSLGVVLYEIIGGRLPFLGDSPMSLVYTMLSSAPPRLRELRPEVPEALDDLVHRAISSDPDERPQTARELGDALTQILEQLPETGTFRTGRTTSRRHRHRAVSADEVAGTALSSRAPGGTIVDTEVGTDDTALSISSDDTVRDLGSDDTEISDPEADRDS